MRGNPEISLVIKSITWVYPPRVRGNLAINKTNFICEWSIPARAGEPAAGAAALSERQVYPRACGGTYLPPG